MTPHSQRLERWLGREHLAALSFAMRAWPGPPIAVAGVPGAVYVTGGGDFCGEYRGPVQMDAVSRAEEVVRRIRREKFQRRYWHQRGAFTSLSALIAAKTGGKSVTMLFNKTGTAPTAANAAMDLWTTAGQPAAGAAGAAAPTGTSPTNATTGNL